MNVKELILSQNIDDLINYEKEHFIPEYEDYDSTAERYEKGFKLSIQDIKNTIPITDSENIIYGIKCQEVNTDETIETTIDHCNIQISELLKMNSNIEIKTFEDIEKANMPNHWGLMFIDWETILGYQVIETDFVSNLELAAEILWELTFFGYGKEENMVNAKKEADILDERSKELDEAIKTGDTSGYISIDDDYFFNLEKKLGLYDGLTDDEIIKVRKEDEIKRKKAIEKTRELMIDVRKKEYEFLKELKKKYEK